MLLDASGEQRGFIVPLSKVPKKAEQFVRRRQSQLALKTARAKRSNRLLIVLVLATASFVTGTIFFWTANVFERMVDDVLVLANDTFLWEWRRQAPVHPHFSLRLFNYTNIDTFDPERGDKLHVEEVGPFVYRESYELVDTEFHDNDTMSFRERRRYEFVPELSADQELLVTTPNLMYLTAVHQSANDGFFTRVGKSQVLRMAGAQPFVKKTVRELFFGYKDPLVDLGRMYTGESIPDVFSLNIMRIDTARYRYSVHTGRGNLSRLAQITALDGHPSVNKWNDPHCDAFDGGSVGYQFPPADVAAGRNLTLFCREFCRPVTLEFEKHVVAQGEDAMRYRPVRDIWAIKGPEDKCFCRDGECPPAGLTDMSPCLHGALMLNSMPHLYLADPKLITGAVEGMRPDPKEHDWHIDVNPRLGITMGADIRTQLNTLVKHVDRFDLGVLNHIPDGTVLPLVWFQMESSGFPQELIDATRMATVVVPVMDRATRYGSLVGAAMSMVLLTWLLIHRRRTCMDCDCECDEPSESSQAEVADLIRNPWDGDGTLNEGERSAAVA